MYMMVATYGWRGSDPKNMLILPTETVVKVAASKNATVFITTSGKLYIGSYNGLERGTLKQVDLGSICVRDAAIYRGQVVLVTDSGNVLTRDLNDGEVQSLPILEPKKTCTHGQEESGRRVQLKAIAAGKDHVLFLSEQNEIWVQGKGPALGLFTNKTENEITNPARLDFFKGRKVLQIESGAFFSVALVEALPPSFQNDSSPETENIPDFDSFVRSCEKCRHENGDKILFELEDGLDKCPLGLAVKTDLLSPSGSSINLDDHSSRNSLLPDDAESSDIQDELDPIFNDSLLHKPAKGKLGTETKEIMRQHKKSEGSTEFEILEVSNNDFEEGEKDECSTSGSLFINTDAARQFISRQLTWMTTPSLDESDDIVDNDKASYKYPIYPIDTATELIKENLANAANSASNIVVSSVQRVSDKVGQLSRHFSSSECAENYDLEITPVTDSTAIDDSKEKTQKPKMSKSNTYECNSLPRRLSNENVKKKSHIRTASGGLSIPQVGGQTSILVEKSQEQVNDNTKLIIDRGQHIINSEVWAWGSANKGQLGLGDSVHRTTPTNIINLNQSGITKIVSGSHHTAALTIDGQVFFWGDNIGGEAGSVAPKEVIMIPQRLSLPAGIIVRDIASGENFLIIVSLNGSVYFRGIVKESCTFEKLDIGPGGIRCKGVLCQNDSIVCLEDNILPQVERFLYTEISYLQVLKHVIKYVIKPFQNYANSKNYKDYTSNNGNISAFENNPIKRVKSALLETFTELTNVVASSIYDALGDDTVEVTSAVPIILQVEEHKMMYQKYLNLVCDAIAISGLVLGTKEANAVMDKFRLEIELIPEEKKKSNNELFSYLLLRPLKRIHEYEELLLNIKNDTENYYSSFSLDKVKIAHSHWRQLSNTAHKNQIEAESTKKFWESCSPKIIEALAIPSRRLLRESKTHMINLHNAGRFSSHYFVLLTDVLVHLQYSNFSTYQLKTMWVEVIPNSSAIQNGIQISLPEDTLTLVCPTSSDKGQWMYALQEGIKRSVNTSIEYNMQVPRAPPLVRTASYTFTKHPQYKDATYTGQWFCGKLHGEGVMNWAEGKCYDGEFRQSVFQGPGKLQVPELEGITSYEGVWKNGKLQGKGIIRYANKDIYSGYLQDSLPHGHGELKKGRFSSSAASIYSGEWLHGVKHGYGVLDEIAQGEKYLGMWQNNQRHGPGMVVTMNGLYYEGNFHQSKLTGFGLMMFEDNTYFEGELGIGGTFGGKGTLYYPSGDTIEGIFSGNWTEGIKINGTLHKGTQRLEETHWPKAFGKLSVPANQKWTAIVQHCKEQLGIHISTDIQTSKVWEFLASHLEMNKQTAHRLGEIECLDGIDTIPEIHPKITYIQFQNIQQYLGKAFESRLHPLGQLLHGLVDAFRATYGGVVSQSRMLKYAVQEVHSYTSQLYKIVRILFPNLPEEGDSLILEPENTQEEEIFVTSSCVIHPWLLPHVYSPLSTLYVLHHHRADEEYWYRLLKWNKQADISLMTFLGVNVKFWLAEGQSIVECGTQFASKKDEYFTEAIETLQMLSTSFSPQDKLRVIHRTFQQINKAVTNKLGSNYLWSMDDLFPVFQYVVVRSRIQHLGAEVQLIDDLLDPHMQHGELGIMFTTLQACYYQIQNEKLSHLS